MIVTLAACVEDLQLMARALINVPPQGQARRGHRDQDADLASDGDRLSGSAPTARMIPRDIITLFICTYNGEESSAPTCSRRSPPTRSCRSSRSRPRAARSRSRWTGDNGFAATETAEITVE